MPKQTSDQDEHYWVIIPGDPPLRYETQAAAENAVDHLDSEAFAAAVVMRGGEPCDFRRRCVIEPADSAAPAPKRGKGGRPKGSRNKKSSVSETKVDGSFFDKDNSAREAQEK